MAPTLTAEKHDVEVASTPAAVQAIPSGAAVAALLASGLGMLALAVVNLAAEASEAFATSLHQVGKLWMPGAAGIGPYSGKETLSAAVWVVSWLVLHPALRGKEMDVARWLVVFLVGIGVATTLLWPPVFLFLVHH
jgi:hypothetical protein